MQSGEQAPSKTSETGLTDCRKRASKSLTLASFAAPASAVVLLAIGLLLCGVMRSLTPSEASFLLQVPDRAGVSVEGASLPVRISAVWAGIAGSMERPARFLSLLSAVVGLGLLAVGLTRLAGGRAAAAGILAIGVTPQFWSSGVGIGSEAPLFFLVCALFVLISGTRSAVVATAIAVLLIVVSLNVWSSWIMAALPVVAVLLAWSWNELKPNPQRVVLGAMVLIASFLVASSAEGGDSHHAERLDWVRTHVDTRATLLIHGPDRHITRYLQTAHHRTGHPCVVIEPSDDLQKLSKQLHLDRHALLVVLGIDDGLHDALSQFYSGEAAREGVSLFRPRKN